jgi:CRISPR-associated endonuclease/helicase Cas3
VTKITELTIEEFTDFIEEIYGYDPFPWQVSLAEEVIEGDGWPDRINIPTGAGKTIVVDIAVFHLAKTAGAEGKKAPRRIFHTVDRRLIVDNVYTKGQELKEDLEGPEQGSVTEKVANSLRELSSTDSVLNVARLRGGVASDEGWMEDPTTPSIIATTVDHSGSRLLFRGYGVSDSSKPIQAGLTGNDALHILDEAHLSKPMEDTLEDIKELRENSHLPFETTSLSATIREKEKAWPPSDALKKDREHEELALRLEAEKETTLHKTANSSDEEDDFVDMAVDSSAELMETEEVSVVGAIVNRVGTARSIFNKLKKVEGSEAILLTGRVRPHDRESTIDRYWDRIKAGRERGGEEDNLFVVATQTIEVGVNIDLDAMVTELAPVDSLKQRFGRLDRYGRIGETEAKVIARHSHTLSTEEDPVYGEILDDVYESLKDQDEPFDMGNSGVSFPEDCPGYSLDDLTVTSNHRPPLIEPYIEKLNQTSPIPDPDPDVSLFLHGIDSSPGEVDVIWRNDIPERIEDYEKVIEQTPPSNKEILSLPIWAFKNWMEGNRTDISDIEGVSEGYNPTDGRSETLRWDSDEGIEVIKVDEVNPGDLIVLPSEAGGYDRYGFNSDVESPVEDIGNDVYQNGTQLPVRIHPDIQDSLKKDDEGVGRLFEVDSTTGEKTIDVPEVESFIEESDEIDVDVEKQGVDFIPYPEENGIVAIESEFAGTDTGHSAVSLPDHTQNVVRAVKDYAEELSLPEDIVDDMVTSAEYHDIGKADIRFQKMLHGGDVVRYRDSTELLAKSGMNASERSEARSKSDYPSGTRHESFSASLLEDSQVLENANDSQLVLHMIASHHGYHRPFLPTPQETVPIEYHDEIQDVRLQTESEYYGLLNFADLTERYGYWKIAYLESILRTGDQKASKEERR